MKITLICLLLFASCTHVPSTQEQIQAIESETGLSETQSPKGEGVYLGKKHRGYDVLFTTEMGNVWGRWAARVTMAEVLAFLSDGKYPPPITGSQLDRLLSRVIGQPLTLTVIVKHNKPNASRLDVITPFTPITTEDPQPKFEYLGMNSGSIYTADLEL